MPNLSVRTDYPDISDGISDTLGDELNARLTNLQNANARTVQVAGDYDEEANYYLGDSVLHDGVRYLHISETSIGVEPGTDAETWEPAGGGSSLSGDIVDALEAASSPSGSNPFVTADDSGLAGNLKTENNLDDLDDAPTARANLGLGSLAEQDSDSLVLTGDVDFGGFKGTNGADGVAPTDFATVNQVALAAAGFAPRPEVRTITTAALPANTRSSNTLTASSNGSINSVGINGITDFAPGDRVLINDESVGAHNGPYEFDSIGSAGAPWVMTRVPDFDTDGEATLGAYYPVREGGDGPTIGGWYMGTQGAITLNTTAIKFYKDPRSDGGEANTITNAGTEGVSLVEGKSGVALQVRSLHAVDGFLSFTYNAAAKSVRAALETAALVTRALYTAKGRLLVGTGAGTVAELAPGADGTVLTCDSGTATGLKYAVPSTDPRLTAHSSTTINLDPVPITRTFTLIQTNRSFTTGMRVVATNTNNNAYRYVGKVALNGYNATTNQLTIDFTEASPAVGSGSPAGNWAIGIAAEAGVEGPVTSTDNALARFDSTTGGLIQDSAVTLSDTGVLTLPAASTPSAPSAGTSLYAKSDGKIYKRAAGGSEEELGAGGGGTGQLPVKTTAERDALTGLSAGYGIWNSTTRRPEWWGGSQWLNALSIFVTKPISTATLNADSINTGIVFRAIASEGSGSVLNDLATSPQDVTLTGPTWGTGDYGPLVEFDGVDDEGNGSDANLPSGSDDCTIAVRLRMPNPHTAGYQFIVSYGTNSSDQLRALYLDPGALGQPAGTQFGGVVTSSESIDDGEFKTVVLRIASGVWNIYVNAAQTTSDTSLSTSTVLSALCIGHNDGSGFFEGEIDSIAIWDRALTLSEIEAFHANPYIGVG